MIPAIFKLFGKAAVAGAGAFVGAAVVSAIAGKDTKEKEPVKEIENKDERYISTAEAAERLSLTEYTIRRKIREGSLSAKNLPGRRGYFIAESEIENYLSGRTKKSSASVSDFDTKIKLLDAEINSSTDSVNPKAIEKYIEGIKLEIQNLELRIAKIAIEIKQNPDDENLKIQRLDLLLEQNEKQQQLQAYSFLLENMNNGNSDAK